MVISLEDSLAWKISEEIFQAITKGKDVTLNDYVSMTKNTSAEEIGCRRLWVVKKEPRIGKYMPQQVLKELLKKFDGRVRYSYSEEDKEFIRKNIGKRVDWLAKYFLVSEFSIRSVIYRIGIRLKRSIGKKYSKEEEQFMKNQYLNITDKRIAEILGRSIEGVRIKRYKTGLIKPQNFSQLLREKI